MSAIHESGDAEPVQVLVSLHDQMNLMDVCGPLEVMSKSLHDASDPSKSLDHFSSTLTPCRQSGIRHHRLC